jgi:hypothetical protein
VSSPNARLRKSTSVIKNLTTLDAIVALIAKHRNPYSSIVFLMPSASAERWRSKLDCFNQLDRGSHADNS